LSCNKGARIPDREYEMRAQRGHAWILIVNFIAFGGIAGFLIYLANKDGDIEETELFRV
jgi:hypothetical protein